MFKAFLLATALLFSTSVCAQTSSDKEEELSSEDMLSKYTNARALCARITDPFTLYERGMLLLSDANDDAYLAAAECFMGAAVRNHTESQIELGYLYEKGNGVVQSDIFAYKWYQTAVLLGNKNAEPYRDNLEKTISLDDITEALPMVQKTLTLIETYAQEQEKELENREKKIADLYKDKFGINLEEYAVKAPEPSSRRLNFLLDNSRNAQTNQQQQGNQQMPMQQQAPAGIQRMQGGGNPFGGQPATMGGMSPARGGAPSF